MVDWKRQHQSNYKAAQCMLGLSKTTRVLFSNDSEQHAYVSGTACQNAVMQ